MKKVALLSVVSVFMGLAAGLVDIGAVLSSCPNVNAWIAKCPGVTEYNNGTCNGTGSNCATSGSRSARIGNFTFINKNGSQIIDGTTEDCYDEFGCTPVVPPLPPGWPVCIPTTKTFGAYAYVGGSCPEY